MTAMTLPPARPTAVRQALDLVRSHPRETAGGGLLLAAVIASIAAVANPSGAVPVRPEAVAAPVRSVQAMTPFAVRQVSADEALKLNAAVPLAGGPNPPALPFVMKAESATYKRALQCLSEAIYYEAARESEEGQRAVAQVVLNRMRHPAYPATVCGVVYQGAERTTGCQFSFTCDGSLARAPMRGYWDRARRVADEALKGHVAAPVGNATHYHANYVLPYWAPTLVKNAVIGAHIFYRWPGGWGQPAAFNQKWAKREGDPAALRSAALAAEARYAAAEPEETTPAVVLQARQELPPELARLVEAELGAKGESRIAVRLDGKRRDEPKAESRELLAAASSSLKWGLTGTTPDAVDQAPLGRKTPTESAAATPPAAAGGAAQ
ncbi:cell wall hydrolase [Sphingomonas sp. LHG3406-1]|uniref:cell wall hydrolase n=1 Tax=Sphingomonas sp. LHG3406-1 TaxID=2804617 RepID=UPI00261316BC|nr:cell wall hydrolase [Sphingomonas sp. LHG3406-1]